MSVSVNYKGNEILNMPSKGSYKLNTHGKYLEDDIQITNSGGSDFIITVSYDDQQDLWVPDCTYADILAANTAGKNIALKCNTDYYNATGDGTLYISDGRYSYYVFYNGYRYEIDLDANGVTIYEKKATATLLQSKTVTPTDSEQIVYPDEGYDALSRVIVNSIPSRYIVPTGTKSITANGTGIDVAQYASVDVNVGGGGGSLKMGVIRPDAELVQTWSGDSLAVADDGVTLPSYSTSQKTLKTSANLTPTVTVDESNYRYYVLYRTLVIPVYSKSTARAAKEEYNLSEWVIERNRIEGSRIKAVSKDTYSNQGNYSSFNTVGTGCAVYWNSATSLYYSFYSNTGSTYGASASPTVPTISGTTFTAKSPYYYLRGSSSMFNSTAWGELTDIRVQYVIELYRVPRNNLDVDGWGNVSQLLHILDDVANNGGVLT